MVKEKLYFIQGYLFDDTINNNGVLNTDRLLSDVRMELQDSNGNSIKVIEKTSRDYAFAGLRAGTYCVVGSKDGYVPGVFKNDNKFDNGKVCVTVGPSTSKIHYGMVKESLFYLQGYIWDDTSNNNGVLNTNNLLSDVRMELQYPYGTSIKVIEKANKNYAFTGLRADTYCIVGSKDGYVPGVFKNDNKFDNGKVCLTVGPSTTKLHFGMVKVVPTSPLTPPPVTEPPVTEPPVTEPPVMTTGEPPVTEPPVTEPPVTEPPVTEPPVTEPPVTEPPVTEPPVTEPPVTEPPVTEPPVTEPPVTEPPVTEPPVTEPPVTEPPVTEPPVTEPPVTEPPVTEPPVTEPPVTEPPPKKGTWKVGIYPFRDDDENGVSSGEEGVPVPLDVTVTFAGNGSLYRTYVNTEDDGDSEYTFANMPPGEYCFELIDPQGKWKSGPVGPGPRRSNNKFVDGKACVELEAVKDGKQEFMEMAAGFVKEKPQTYKVAGFTFIDTNQDGYQDEDEDYLADITVKLYNSDGKLVYDEDTTAEYNGYEITGLVAGDYCIVHIGPDGYNHTVKGTHSFFDQDQDNLHEIKLCFTLPNTDRKLPENSSKKQVRINSGWKKVPQTTRTIKGYVFLDANRNNKYDDAPPDGPETFIAGASVKLIVDGEIVERTESTASNPSYEFKNLPANKACCVYISQPNAYEFIPVINEYNRYELDGETPCHTFTTDGVINFNAGLRTRN
ncbi:hypothetical protein SAMD00019534_033770 [Acytostelium subglobosum LB1]|uniref:hypothetical protein n=1 Tax=Acytostelium subglobosum LB1 TaxID=1410327 RepID=UPI000644B3DC|nr:hypothetical protein SAMD00019534_033770 [Acytostelium subglobosum LB1]GAM20202.1 hypothetical protein SAMD00019534_033770 [Acytostelium subglobosum LB1]|eukprot:XP_012759723.1 hypothetical protein SAMD00019534_033770 [Acytostelium subglobosum LB1]